MEMMLKIAHYVTMASLAFFLVACIGKSAQPPETQTQLCRIVSVTENQTEVTVETPDGNEYSFYTDGTTDCVPGSEWEVTFDSEMEIISVQ
jgi:hypothetical protein